jgi:hypothetical protein
MKAHGVTSAFYTETRHVDRNPLMSLRKLEAHRHEGLLEKPAVQSPWSYSATRLGWRLDSWSSFR